MNQSFEFQERWYQTEAEQAVFDFLNSNPGKHPLVCMPTGTGKGPVIAKLIRRMFQAQPWRRVLQLTHDEKVLKQNIEKLQMIWPTAPMGVCAAGMNKRDTVLPIIFGMFKSVAGVIKRALKESANHFGWIDAVIVDEAHLLSPEEDTTYQFIIAELRKTNPDLVVIGFTATPYRMKQGMLTDGGSIFTDICYDITDIESFNRLIAEGYLAMLIPKPTATQINLEGVKITGGEFNSKQADERVDQYDIVEQACREMVESAYDRDSWIVFGSSIKNAEHINEMLQGMGIVSTVVHSEEKDSEKRIEDFKGGMYQCIVNKSMLTTGFDHPPVNFIGDLDPTNSPSKHVQKMGRGTRPWPGKNNCLVLDFAGNVKRIGPINDPKKPRPPGKATGDIPIKVCPVEGCNAYNHASARTCCLCGHEFKFENKLTETASTNVIVKSNEDVIEIMPVKKVIYNLHEKQGMPPSIRVTYFCATRRFDEWVMLEHPGRMGIKARAWWKRRSEGNVPITTNEALYKVSTLPWPKQIKVITNRKYPEVIDHEL